MVHVCGFSAPNPTNPPTYQPYPHKLNPTPHSRSHLALVAAELLLEDAAQVSADAAADAAVLQQHHVFEPDLGLGHQQVVVDPHGAHLWPNGER